MISVRCDCSTQNSILDYMKKLSFLLSLLGLLITYPIFAQDCQDGIQNGEELNVDCGGPDCPFCLPILYDIICVDITGTVQLEVFLPDYLWTNGEELFDEGFFYDITGALDIGDLCFTIDECQGAVDFSDATSLEIEFWKKMVPFDNPSVVGYGQIQAFPVCTKQDTSTTQCPPDSEFAVTAQKIERDDEYHMIKLDMIGGTPPYDIFDEQRQLYYRLNHPNDTYYLGVIPDDVELILTVRDSLNCTALVVGVEGCNDTYNLLTTPSSYDCDAQDMAVGSVELEAIPNACQYLLEYNGVAASKIENLEAGTYTMQLININATVGTSIEVTIPAEGAIFDPLVVELSKTDPESCSGVATNGRLEATVSGGIGPYQYNWMHCGETCNEQSIVENLSAGDYNLSVLDMGTGCSKNVIAQLIQENSTNDEAFSLSPTLFDNEINLHFCLEEDTRISLAAYAINGDYLGLFINNELLSTGAYDLPINTSHFANGTYIFTLQFNDDRENLEIFRMLKL